MQKLRRISQNFNEILTFENFEKIKILLHLDLRTSPFQFLKYRAHLLDLVYSLCVLKRLYDQLKKIIFLIPPFYLWGRKFKLKFCPKFSFWTKFEFAYWHSSIIAYLHTFIFAIAYFHTVILAYLHICNCIL